LRRSSNAGRAGSSARQHDYESSYGLRRGQGHGQRCLPVQSQHAPGAPSHAPVCAIQRRRLSGSSSVATSIPTVTAVRPGALGTPGRFTSAPCVAARAAWRCWRRSVGHTFAIYPSLYIHAVPTVLLCPFRKRHPVAPAVPNFND
jgi:hypothetical protein